MQDYYKEVSMKYVYPAVFTLEPKLDLKELYQAFFQAKVWKDVVDQYPELGEDSFSIDEDFILNEHSSGNLQNEHYSPISVKMNSNNLSNNLRQSAAFWSTRNQSGSTFLAVNTALLFSQDLNKKVLLVDANINNPNIHLHLNYQSNDPNQNLSALCQQRRQQPARRPGGLRPQDVAGRGR